MQNDRFFRMERNLWLYFLTEPKKVLECIKEVQKKAAEVGSVSFKAMNITIPKQNWKWMKQRKTFSFWKMFTFISFSEIGRSQTFFNVHSC